MESEPQEITLKVEGMTCTSCASSIERFLKKQNLKDIKVNYIEGWVKFQDQASLDIKALADGINKLGYQAILDGKKKSNPLISIKTKLLVSSIFTFPLLLHHVLPGDFHFLHSSLIQFLLALPPVVIGLYHFLPGAFKSVMSGVPNMDVTICLGAIAESLYSVAGWILNQPDMIFFETGASILTLVLLGNFIEQKAIKKTTNAIQELQSFTAEYGKVKMPSGAILNIPLDQINRGDLLVVSEGDAIPADGKIISGVGVVDESIITGESKLIHKSPGEKLVGSSQLISGNVILKVEQIGGESYFGRIITLVKNATLQKAPVQKTADKISAVFVPVILMISLTTFILNYLVFHYTMSQALLRAIAVLVISCPCAMGLATPTAIIVGLGKALRQGILIKGAVTLELLGKIRQIVFDKTGTLTYPDIDIVILDKKTEDEIIQAIYAIESRSSHPIALAVLKKIEKNHSIRSQQFEVIETKGIGMVATDSSDQRWEIKLNEISGKIEVNKSDKTVALIIISDQLKEDSHILIQYLINEGIKPFILSGDDKKRVEEISKKLSVQDWSGRVMPEEKIAMINKIRESGITAMVGDGINDAPALSAADIAISFGHASNAAIQSSQVILLNGKLSTLYKAIHIGRQTLRTIRQNLFWAFSYNIIAIPLAALGYLNPMWGVVFMAFSDFVIIGNSLRLRWSNS
ncbi:MAG: cation-translocating P-type ATPase [Saprospiraceae bacterium]